MPVGTVLGLCSWLGKAPAPKVSSFEFSWAVELKIGHLFFYPLFSISVLFQVKEQRIAHHTPLKTKDGTAVLIGWKLSCLEPMCVEPNLALAFPSIAIHLRTVEGGKLSLTSLAQLVRSKTPSCSSRKRPKISSSSSEPQVEIDEISWSLLLKCVVIIDGMDSLEFATAPCFFASSSTLGSKDCFNTS